MYSLRLSKRLSSRYGAAALVLLMGMLLAACSAKGKGTLAPNVEGVPVNDDIVVNLGKATFDFDLTCGIVNGKPRVAGFIKYHDRGATLLNSVPLYGPVKIDGELAILTVTVNGQEITTDAQGCEAYDALNNPAPGSVAQFLGTYSAAGGKHNSSLATYGGSKGDKCEDQASKGDDDDCETDPAREGNFVLLVFDQRGTNASLLDMTGDAFSLELIGGPYTTYTRSGYIERGDIKVRN